LLSLEIISQCQPTPLKGIKGYDKIDKIMQKRTAEEILKNYQKLIWPNVKSYLKSQTIPKAFQIASKYKKEEQKFWEIVKDYPTRKGKYLRPTLVCLTAEAVGAKLEDTLPTASAMQISEEWLLIHDDLEDDSPKRRGLPALHKKYNLPIAVNAGDALHNIMWKALFENRKILGEKKTFQILDEFNTQLFRTTLGQMTEIIWRDSVKNQFDDSDWYFIADGKTSYYTIACPMRLGAIIADANQNQLEKLAQFGVLLGRAFQLQDDILDVTSDFGGRKEFAGDIYEGKLTVILGQLLKRANKKDKQRLTSFLNKKREEKTKDEVLWVVSKMKEYEAISYAQNLANEFKDKAKVYFQKELTFLKKEPAREELLTLIDFITERKY
jgi:geranylgeranyl diphosphate synthase type II